MINNIFHKDMSKYCKLMLRKLKLQKKNTAQAAFRKGRSCAHHIFVIRVIIETMKIRRNTLHTCFVDFTKAFDSVPRAKLWEVLDELGYHQEL